MDREVRTRTALGDDVVIWSGSLESGGDQTMCRLQSCPETGLFQCYFREQLEVAFLEVEEEAVMAE